MEDIPKDPPGQAGESGETDTENLARFESLLVELSRSLKAVNFYPRGHPTLMAALEKSQSAFNQAIEGKKQLGFTVTKDGFNYQSKHIAPSNTNLPPLARELFLRQIKKIFFLPELSAKELENFLRVIAMEEELFRGEGRAEDYLLDNGVEHIWFNEMKFGQKRNAPKPEEQPPAAEEGMDERIRHMIEALLAEKDPRKFLGLSRDASITAQRLMDEDKTEYAFEIFRTFKICFSSRPERPPLIVEASRAAFSELATKPMIEFIMRQLTLLHGPRQEEVMETALELDEKLIEAILDKLSTNEALYSHRALIQILLQIPDRAREMVESRLKDERWHVVRKMAFLLGEIGKAESVGPLIEASGNPDTRVSKEAMKSLSKIKNIESSRYLVGLINPKTSSEIMAHVVRLLAGMKEVSAVPSLLKLLKKRGMLLENIEILQEIVRALGQIGSQQAVPVLEEILFKRSFFAKSRSLALGLNAAEALGNIGGKSATDALQKGVKHKDPEISAASRKALQVIEGVSADSGASGKPAQSGPAAVAVPRTGREV